MPSHFKSVLQALLVTFLWSTSVIFIKIGLQTLPPLTFAGLRYGLACLFLLPLTWHACRRVPVSLSRSDWRRLIVLGLVMYTFTQGAQFMALQLLPATAHSMMLNSTVIIAMIAGVVWLSEYSTRLQMIGLVLFAGGIALYFLPADFSGAEVIGLSVAMFQVLANAVAVTLGRAINRTATIPALVITTISMAFGAVLLILAGMFTQGVPQIDPQSAIIILWLAGVNTAFAFTLWNHTQRTLSAMESSMINNTMLIQIGLLAWIFLGESLTPQQISGMIVASGGILLVQLRRAQ